MFVSDAWPALATFHRSFCELCDQRVGRSLQRERPVQISWRSRWFCQSMSVQDSESRRFEQTLGRYWPKIGPGIIFFGVFETLETFFSRFVLIATGTEIFWRVSLKF